ncbi:caskin-2 isoform X2 [Frankliniella occidentalis]|uniref:Caskin-2 isoform X2 n=1 Tax=Frankliniella occidentalis TaxID=133901 RepID=A0A9C6X1W8_FRAOC|nr:caskin-2 isoform X2 [Frankliniella occidentalis]
MATCFGPPPLPPNKRPGGALGAAVGGLAGRRQRRQHMLLQQQLAKQHQLQDSNNNTSSTYKSFRDDQDDQQQQQHAVLGKQSKKGSRAAHPPPPPPLPPTVQPLRVPALSLQMPKLMQQHQPAAPPPRPPPASLKPNLWAPGSPPTPPSGREPPALAVWTASPTTPLGRRRCRKHARTLSLTTDALLTPPTPPPPLLLPPKPGTPPTFRHGRTAPAPRQAPPPAGGTLCRSASPRAGQVGRIGLRRSRSEGNLAMPAPGPASDGGLGLDPHEPRGLQRCLKALSGSWKNLLQLGGMSRPAKSAPLAKKVAPPAVPGVFRHSGSSFGSAGYCSSEDPGDILRDVGDHTDIYGMAGKSPGQMSYPAFTFPGPQGMSQGKVGPPFFQHQLSLQEDQGIDMTQSPGRDSPGSAGSGSGSGSRHSTASLDSGRASGTSSTGYHHLVVRGMGLSSQGTASSTLSSSSSPRCSISSSSLGSSEHGNPGLHVERLLQQGVPDCEVVLSWLQDLHFEEYYHLFVGAGYDMPTISRMTPEDLTAIGIKNPNHRKKLKVEIAQLNINDGLPDYIPGSLDEWLRLLRLEEYLVPLQRQGYHSVENVTTLAWEDLEDIGIVKLGHQKKVLLAIRRVQDLRAGKRIQPPQDVFVTEGSSLNSPDEEALPPLPLPGAHKAFHTFHQPWETDTMRQPHHMVLPSSAFTVHQPMYSASPEFVPIKIRGGRGKSLESLEDSNEVTHHTFSPENTQTFYYQHAQPMHGWRRSYDDGDLTPTNELASMALHEGGGTLPRHRGPGRPRPVAKVTANTSSTFNASQATLLARDWDSPRKRPPSPPKRQSSSGGRCGNLSDSCDSVDGVGGGGRLITTTVELHHPLPAYPSPCRPSPSQDSFDDLPLPPPPAPSTPPSATAPRQPSWSNGGQPDEMLIASLSKQPGRTGSDASFKSSSSTESDSLPFANENAGTIKQRANRPHPSLSSLDSKDGKSHKQAPQHRPSLIDLKKDGPQEPSDVLNDIGNMLANLTDELDAMLEEEKRQGLNND